MGKELNVLKKLSKQSKRDFDKAKKIKIKVQKAKELNENDKELLKLAEIYPTNTQLQQMKIRMLKKNHIIEKSDLEESVSSRYSANSVNTGKADMFKIMG
jgi:actin-related protein